MKNKEDALRIFGKETDLIKDDSIRNGVCRILIENEDQLRVQPTSLSALYHPKDPTVMEHLKRTVWFAHELAREFDITGEDYDILISAALLHDIGLMEITAPGKIEAPGWKYYPETNFSRKLDGAMEMHPIYGSIIIGKKPFKCSRRIQNLVEVHMEHWYNKTCRLPNDLLEYCVCIADYLASRDITINNPEYAVEK